MTDLTVPVCAEEVVDAPSGRAVWCPEPVIGLAWRKGRWAMACAQHGGNTLQLGAARLVQLGSGKGMRQVLDAQELHYCSLIGAIPE